MTDQQTYAKLLASMTSPNNASAPNRLPAPIANLDPRLLETEKGTKLVEIVDTAIALSKTSPEKAVKKTSPDSQGKIRTVISLTGRKFHETWTSQNELVTFTSDEDGNPDGQEVRFTTLLTDTSSISSRPLNAVGFDHHKAMFADLHDSIGVSTNHVDLVVSLPKAEPEEGEQYEPVFRTSPTIPGVTRGPKDAYDANAQTHAIVDEYLEAFLSQPLISYEAQG